MASIVCTAFLWCAGLLVIKIYYYLTGWREVTDIPDWVRHADVYYAGGTVQGKHYEYKIRVINSDKLANHGHGMRELEYYKRKVRN